MKKSLEFSYLYSTSIFEKINSNLSTKLIYDIGLASGIGLLGLQGPEKLKKTTITGESAGTAKRLETEAKNSRSANPCKIPILLIDELLFQCTKTMAIFKYRFEEIIATTKDIKDSKFYKHKNQ